MPFTSGLVWFSLVSGSERNRERNREIERIERSQKAHATEAFKSSEIFESERLLWQIALCLFL